MIVVPSPPPTSSPPAGRPWLQRLIAATAALAVIFIVWVIAVPNPIAAIAVEPPPWTPLTGPLEPNTSLRQATLVGVDQVHGPEDVALDAQGRIYGGNADGAIVRVSPDGTVETVASTGGRPLGLDFDPAGHLVVADGLKGLLRVAPDGSVSTLTTEADGVAFRFTDDVDVASDGRIYFSDASSRFGLLDYTLDLLEGRPHGRLLRYDPASGKTEVLLDSLYFANGVALSQDESFVIVVETYAHRIQRYWLKGPKAGTSEIFADALPGYPDGVSSNGKGTFWLALLTVRNTTADFLAPHPWLKGLIGRLPRALWPKPEPYGFVVALNEDGRYLRSLQDPDGEHIHTISSVEEHREKLYLGSLHNHHVGVVKLNGGGG